MLGEEFESTTISLGSFQYGRINLRKGFLASVVLL